MTAAVIAIDPGLVSGIAVVTQDSGGALHLAHSAELDPMTTGEVFRDLAEQYALGASVVIERFTITSATAKNSQAPWSLKVIGMLEWLIWEMYGQPPGNVIVEQGPAEAKRLITNDILKKQQLWHKGGAGHANDAIRHAVYRYARTGWRDPWLS